ncbi:hypothetical protein ACFZAU_09235 [Streptomyces sp. NPDC008238]
MGPTVFASPFAHRRAATARLAALALTTLTTLALGACSGEGTDGGPTGRTDAAASASPVPAPSSAPASPPATPRAEDSGTPSPVRSTGAPAADGGTTGVAERPADGPTGTPSPQAPARWAGSKQFVQVERAWIEGGHTYLSVRAARREVLTGPIEGWQLIPGKGPYTTVRMAPAGRVLLSVPLGDVALPHAYSQDQFIRRWWAQPVDERGWLGYDVSFDRDGEVVRLQSIYRA